MSSLTNMTNSKISLLLKLKTYFDIVEVNDAFEKYTLLTCKDKVSRAGCHIEFSIWLEVKINKQNKNDKYCVKTDNEYIECCVKSILDWIDLLVVPEQEKTIQLSLFDFLPDIKHKELVEPLSPSGDNDNNWSKYFKDLYKYRIENLKKQYGFFDLFNDTSSFWLYRDIDWNKLLPTKEETFLEFKRVISKYKDNFGRFDDGWFEKHYQLESNNSLSDYELLDCVMSTTRLLVGQYTRFKRVFVDDGYTGHIMEESIDSRFWFSGRDFLHRTKTTYYGNGLLQHDLFVPEFIDWLRSELNIKKADYISDDDAIKNSLHQFMQSYFGVFDWEDAIKNSSSSKEFISKKQIYSTKDRNGGSSGSYIDGYHTSISYDGKCKVEVTQNEFLREYLKRDISNRNSFDVPIIITLEGDQIFEKAFELFKIEKNKQSLFEF